MIDERWLVEDRVRYTGFTGATTSEEIFEIDGRMVTCLEASSHPIHFVIDVRGLSAPLGLDQGLKIRHLRHEKTGWIIIIGGSQNSVVRFVISATFKIFGAKYKDCDSSAAAIDFLKQMDPELAGRLMQA